MIRFLTLVSLIGVPAFAQEAPDTAEPVTYADEITVIELGLDWLLDVPTSDAHDTSTESDLAAEARAPVPTPAPEPTADEQLEELDVQSQKLYDRLCDSFPDDPECVKGALLLD